LQQVFNVPQQAVFFLLKILTLFRKALKHVKSHQNLFLVLLDNVYISHYSQWDFSLCWNVFPNWGLSRSISDTYTNGQ